MQRAGELTGESKPVSIYCGKSHMNGNFFRSSLPPVMENTSFAMSVVMYEVPEAILICPTKDTTTGTAAVTEVIMWVNLTWSTVILQGVFYIGFTGEVNGYVMWTPTQAIL